MFFYWYDIRRNCPLNRLRRFFNAFTLPHYTFTRLQNLALAYQLRPDFP